MPVFLYEKSASAPHRENLAAIRKGEFEGMAEKIRQPEWKPDFGCRAASVGGNVAIGARMPLVAYNVNLGTANLEIASSIAKKIRFIGGGLRYCKAMGVELKERGIVQVSINMTDYTRYRPLPRFRTGTYRGTSLRCSGCRKRDHRAGSDGGVDRHGFLLFGTGRLFNGSGVGSQNNGIDHGG